MYCLGRQVETTAWTSSCFTLTPGRLSVMVMRSSRVRFFKLLQRETFLSQWFTPGWTRYKFYYTIRRSVWDKTKKLKVQTVLIPCMIPYILSWSLFCSLHSRSRWRTCCWGEQVFFSLSRLLRSTLRPGRLSKSRSRGTEDSRSDESDW